MNQIDHYLKMKKTEVAFFCTYLEAFEGMAAVRTPNPGYGDETVLHVMVSPDYSEQFNEILNGLRKDISIEKVEP
jgi:hypothetical protein